MATPDKKPMLFHEWEQLGSPDTPELREQLEALEERIEHADPKTEAERAEWILDRWELFLFCETPLGFDAVAERAAEIVLEAVEDLEGPSPDWPSNWIKRSENDLLAWRVCQILVARLRHRDPWLLSLSPLNDWAWDAASGVRNEPRAKRGRRSGTNVFRNLAMALAVEQVVEVARTMPWSSSSTRGSVCHVVAKRLGYSYDTVHRISREFRRGKQNAE